MQETCHLAVGRRLFVYDLRNTLFNQGVGAVRRSALLGRRRSQSCPMSPFGNASTPEELTQVK